jgi:hypothetical protein
MLTVLHEGEMKSLSVKLGEEVIYLNNEKDKVKLKDKS